eukprot:GFYU01004506.1.p1 GENE.GFYU01004506.1~~GFYU01004506.1.p1  ORF type:complete len:896 (+),score=256.74 GFYU01004506.1:310-2688(+)
MCQIGSFCMADTSGDGATCKVLTEKDAGRSCPKYYDEALLFEAGFYCKDGTVRELRAKSDICVYDDQCRVGVCSHGRCVARTLGQGCTPSSGTRKECDENLFCSTTSKTCTAHLLVSNACEGQIESACGSGLTCSRVKADGPKLCLEQYTASERSYCSNNHGGKTLGLSDQNYCQWGQTCKESTCTANTAGNSCDDLTDCDSHQYCAVSHTSKVCTNVFNNDCTSEAQHYAACVAKNNCNPQGVVSASLTDCVKSNCFQLYAKFACCASDNTKVSVSPFVLPTGVNCDDITTPDKETPTDAEQKLINKSSTATLKATLDVVRVTDSMKEEFSQKVAAELRLSASHVNVTVVADAVVNIQLKGTEETNALVLAKDLQTKMASESFERETGFAIIADSVSMIASNDGKVRDQSEEKSAVQVFNKETPLELYHGTILTVAGVVAGVVFLLLGIVAFNADRRKTSIRSAAREKTRKKHAVVLAFLMNKYVKQRNKGMMNKGFNLWKRSCQIYAAPSKAEMMVAKVARRRTADTILRSWHKSSLTNMVRPWLKHWHRYSVGLKARAEVESESGMMSARSMASARSMPPEAYRDMYGNRGSTASEIGQTSDRAFYSARPSMGAGHSGSISGGANYTPRSENDFSTNFTPRPYVPRYTRESSFISQAFGGGGSNNNSPGQGSSVRRAPSSARLPHTGSISHLQEGQATSARGSGSGSQFFSPRSAAMASMANNSSIAEQVSQEYKPRLSNGSRSGSSSNLNSGIDSPGGSARGTSMIRQDSIARAEQLRKQGSSRMKWT